MKRRRDHECRAGRRPGPEAPEEESRAAREEAGHVEAVRGGRETGRALLHPGGMVSSSGTSPLASRLSGSMSRVTWKYCQTLKATASPECSCMCEWSFTHLPDLSL